MYEVYLTELLTLFVDKGVAVQNVAVSAQSAKVRGQRNGSHFLANICKRRRK